MNADLIKLYSNQGEKNTHYLQAQIFQSLPLQASFDPGYFLLVKAIQEL